VGTDHKEFALEEYILVESGEMYMDLKAERKYYSLDNPEHAAVLGYKFVATFERKMVIGHNLLAVPLVEYTQPGVVDRDRHCNLKPLGLLVVVELKAAHFGTLLDKFEEQPLFSL
jgi:hypothetical protein